MPLLSLGGGAPVRPPSKYAPLECKKYIQMSKIPNYCQSVKDYSAPTELLSATEGNLLPLLEVNPLLSVFLPL